MEMHDASRITELINKVDAIQKLVAMLPQILASVEGLPAFMNDFDTRLAVIEDCMEAMFGTEAADKANKDDPKPLACEVM